MDYLQNAQPGDRFALRKFGNFQRIVTVERVTKTQIVVNTGLKYRKDTGYEVGNIRTIGNGYLVPITEEIEAGLEGKKLIGYICRTSWASVPIEKLRQIKNILDS